MACFLHVRIGANAHLGEIKYMTNELTTLDNLTTEQIMEMTGQGKKSNWSPFPFVTINRQDEDDDGNVIPKGTYVLTEPETKELVYGNPAYFRPFIQTFQYRVYDAGQEQFTNKTILFKSFNDEAFDELGGLSCGKVNRKKWEQLTKDEQEQQRAIKCRRLMFGTISMNGVFKRKAKEPERTVELKDVPVIWVSQGNSFIPVGDAISAMTNKNKLMFNYKLELTTKREKNGSNVYYIADAKPMLKEKPIALSKEDMELMKSFQEYITQENSFVMEKWERAHRKQSANKNSKDLDLVAELSAPADDGFADKGLGVLDA